MKEFFLYIHTRLDNNEVFYVGIGTCKKMNKGINVYERAYTKNRRNHFWQNVVNKTDYKVAILHVTTDREEICELEKKYILKYGRRDLNTGTLTNLTEGGDANFTMNKDVIKKIVETKRKTGGYDKISKIQKNKMKGNKYGITDHKEGKHLFVYSADTGKFYAEYISLPKCCRDLLHIKNKSAIVRAIRIDGTYHNFRFFYEYKGDTVDPKERHIIKNKRKVIAYNDNEKLLFESISEVSKKFDCSVSNITIKIKSGKIYKNFKFKFDISDDDVYEESLRINTERSLNLKGNTLASGHHKGKSIYVYEAETGKFYNEFKSLKGCAEIMFQSSTSTTITKAMKRNGTNRGYRFFYEYKGEQIDPYYINPKSKRYKN